MDKENKLVLYKDEEGRVSVNTRFADEDVWLTQALCVLYRLLYRNKEKNLNLLLQNLELSEKILIFADEINR